MRQYIDLINKILNEGVYRQDRTGTGTVAIFGHQMRFDMHDGFPVVTTKRVHLKSVIHELLWFLSGDTNTQYLRDNKVSIWDEWADENGDLGPVYGKQWRNWPGGIDQIQALMDEINTRRNSRRQIVSAWNPSDISCMALAPCHCLFQTSVMNGKLSLQLYQRSADVFLGLPFNISSYALLLHMLAQQCELEPGELVWTGGDVHIYVNHLKQVKLQSERPPYPLPELRINRHPDSIFDYRYTDFDIINYRHHPQIKGKVAV